MRRNRLILAIVVALLCTNAATASAATTKTLSEVNSNRAITLKVGVRVTLTLHSLYWVLILPSKSSPLVRTGAPILQDGKPGDPPGTPVCHVVGDGCGIQIWNFVAIKVGTTHLRAFRTSCGEAMRCTGTEGQFDAKVKIVPAF